MDPSPHETLICLIGDDQQVVPPCKFDNARQFGPREHFPGRITWIADQYRSKLRSDLRLERCFCKTKVRFWQGERLNADIACLGHQKVVSVHRGKGKDLITWSEECAEDGHQRTRGATRNPNLLVGVSRNIVQCL